MMFILNSSTPFIAPSLQNDITYTIKYLNISYILILINNAYHFKLCLRCLQMKLYANNNI